MVRRLTDTRQKRSAGFGFFTNIWYLPAPKMKIMLYKNTREKRFAGFGVFYQYLLPCGTKMKIWVCKNTRQKQNLLWCFTMYITNNIWYLLGTNLETLVKVKTSFKRNLCKSMRLQPIISNFHFNFHRNDQLNGVFHGFFHQFRH
jgi:hypothetical protein